MKRLLVMFVAAFALVACGSDSVEGNTYETNGGMITIAFKSGGKATFSVGPAAQDCTYSQNGKSVALTCQGDKTEFTLADDGSLQGPPQGMVGRLTKKKA